MVAFLVPREYVFLLCFWKTDDFTDLDVVEVIEFCVIPIYKGHRRIGALVFEFLQQTPNRKPFGQCICEWWYVVFFEFGC